MFCSESNRERTSTSMTTRTYANQANHMAGNTRVRGFRPCPVSAFAVWSPITLGTDRKHGRPRRLEVSHP